VNENSLLQIKAIWPEGIGYCAGLSGLLRKLKVTVLKIC